MTVPVTEEVILADGAELKRWDVYNKHIFSINPRHSKQLPRPLCREVQLEATTKLAGVVKGIGRKTSQLINAAGGCSITQTERHGHDAKPRPC